MRKDELVSVLSTRLKELNYRKQNLNWRKKNNSITIMFNIQNSYYSKEDFYINLGIYIHDIGDVDTPKIYECQVQQRIEARYDADELVKILLLWEEWYGSLEKLRDKARSNKMPVATTVDAITYLTSI